MAKVYAQVVGPKEGKYVGMIGWVGRVDHNDVQLHFEDGTSKHFHAMALKKVEKPDGLGNK